MTPTPRRIQTHVDDPTPEIATVTPRHANYLRPRSEFQTRFLWLLRIDGFFGAPDGDIDAKEDCTMLGDWERRYARSDDPGERKRELSQAQALWALAVIVGAVFGIALAVVASVSPWH